MQQGLLSAVAPSRKHTRSMSETSTLLRTYSYVRLGRPCQCPTPAHCSHMRHMSHDENTPDGTGCRYPTCRSMHMYVSRWCICVYLDGIHQMSDASSCSPPTPDGTACLGRLPDNGSPYVRALIRYVCTGHHIARA
eukprot:83739-Rhodomonas_salina.2